MKKFITAIFTASVIALSAPSVYSADDVVMSNNGGVPSLRGLVEISDVNQSEALKKA